MRRVIDLSKRAAKATAVAASTVLAAATCQDSDRWLTAPTPDGTAAGVAAAAPPRDAVGAFAVPFGMTLEVDPTTAAPRAAIAVQSIGNYTVTLPTSVTFVDADGVVRTIANLREHSRNYRQVDVAIRRAVFARWKPDGTRINRTFFAQVQQLPAPNRHRARINWALIQTLDGDATADLGYYRLETGIEVQLIFWYPMIDPDNPFASREYRVPLAVGGSRVTGRYSFTIENPPPPPPCEEQEEEEGVASDSLEIPCEPNIDTPPDIEVRVVPRR